MKEKYDVIIIGSGIAGMTAGIYLKRSGLDVLIIEENAPGGTLNRVNIIENYPGFIKTDGPSLAAEIFNQVRNLDIEYFFDKVVKVDLTKELKKVVTGGATLYCKYLVIATGRLSKKLFNNDDRYIGKGISYCALCDGNLYKGKEVIVVGGANSALEEALYLSSICKNVTMVVRGETLRGDESLINQVTEKNNIKVVYNSNVSEYNIENNKLVSVKLDDESIIDTAGLFISIGSVPSADMFDVEKDKGFIIVDTECMTNIENVYACGDVIKKSVYQLTTAASEGTIVAYSIIKKNKK
ncbi:MAG: FAD-dependent oxidoreductase [Bacilli bacterium]|nr:FAD-dependent oxidoreductase [Bacilli bacterium]